MLCLPGLANLDWRLSAIIAWLADEYAFRDYDITQDLAENSLLSQDLILNQLRRKLSSRTRGLPEISEQPTVTTSAQPLHTNIVSFTHRTGLEWVIQPNVRSGVRQLCGGDDFDPHLFLLEMLSISMASPKLCPTSDPKPKERWSLLLRPALFCATRVSLRSPEQATVQRLVRVLDIFDGRAQAIGKRVSPYRTTWSPAKNHRSSSYLYHNEGDGFQQNWRENSFINVATQFAILLYLEAKASSTNWRKALF